MGTLSNHHTDNSTMEEAQVAVIMVPFLAQGHLNQLLQLSCIISSYGIPVSYACSDIHIQQAKARANGFNPLAMGKIQFHDMPIPPFASPPPDPNSPSKFPTQLQPAWDASLNLREPFREYLEEMSHKFKRVVVVHDPMMAVVVQDVGFIDNAESYVFNCLSAFCQISFIMEKIGKPFPIKFSKELPSFEGCIPEEVQKSIVAQAQAEQANCSAGDIYNTCRPIEATYLELLEREEIAGNRKSWAIGPILPAALSLSLSSSADKPENKHKCLEWLDKQEAKSVIYVSFGTTVSLPDEAIQEIALGLEQSKVKFLWSLREADKGNVFDGDGRRANLPEGFEERVEGMGLVVRDWAPQPQILAHPSTGGFMSHCGWNSCIESITAGVPIAAWPMHSDQPRNTFLITEILKMGLVVREWAQRMEPVKASTIGDVVKRLMASQEGNEIRTRAEELATIAQKATQLGGASRLELESFIAHITR